MIDGTLPPLSSSSPNGVLTSFFLGHEWNPRFFGIDVKMVLYAIGAIQLQLNVLSFSSYQLSAWEGEISVAMTLYCILFTWFLGEYMLFEAVHLYTYDLFAEKIGFKLIWGCLTFYPYFYPICGYYLAQVPKGNDISAAVACVILFVFLTGWVITRGANMQKFFFRRYPSSQTFLFGLVKQKTVPGSRILCGGWWGVARHFNYLGEIIQAFSLSLPLLVLAGDYTGRIVALSYPLYYVLLFVPRQIDDDALCRIKYKKLWDDYEALVPWRICPFVY